jgi:hypothetical protein
MKEPVKWNPRYLAYCRAHGENDPDAMRAADDERWPGGRACGFILWMSAQWAAWRKANGRGTWDVKTEDDQTSFDRMIGASP